jgi:hypothetical protein
VLQGVKRWEENWRAIAPPAAIRADVPRSFSDRQACASELRSLPAGSPVVLVAAAPRAGAGCRQVAEHARLTIERNYLAFPSAAAPAYLVEDERASAQVFVQTVLTVPPQSRLALPMQAALRLLRLFGAWRFLRLVAPGRVAVGRRT